MAIWTGVELAAAGNVRETISLGRFRCISQGQTGQGRIFDVAWQCYPSLHMPIERPLVNASWLSLPSLQPKYALKKRTKQMILPAVFRSRAVMGTWSRLSSRRSRSR